MSDDKREFYERRIARVLRYIGEHLDEDLSVGRLSDVAGFSKHHFHRQFTALMGISVGRFVTLLRLKRASMQLSLEPERKVLEVALDAGFETPEAFARAFKSVQGQSPSAFRTQPEWESWVATFRSKHSTHKEAMTPTIVQFPETRVAVLEHRGAPESIMSSVMRFIDWRKSCDVSPEPSSQTYGIAYDDPATTEPSAFRFDICGEAKRSVPSNAHGVVEKVIPGGRCAVARHLGSTDTIGDTVMALYRDWLPQSGEELRDFPRFFHYIARMPKVSEHEQVTDVYLPLR